MALRWGIVSAGRISHDFVTAVQLLPSSDHKVAAIAARSQSSADTFAKDHNIPTAYEGYDKLAQDPNIDVVYVGNLNPQHFEVSSLMLDHGKHVVCEKPLTMNEQDSRKLIEKARQKKLFFTEGVWSRFFPAYKKMRELIEAGEIGEVRFAQVSFGFDLTHVDRLNKKDMGGSAVLDLGVYILQFQQYVFRGLKPLKVVTNGHVNEEGCDETVSAIITYENGKTAVVTCSAAAKLPNEGIIVGTKGTMTLPEFWCPTKLITPSKTYEYELPKSKVEFLHHNSAGFTYEAEDVRQSIQSGALETAHITQDESIQLAHLMDTLRKGVGAFY